MNYLNFYCNTRGRRLKYFFHYITRRWTKIKITLLFIINYFFFNLIRKILIKRIAPIFILIYVIGDENNFFQLYYTRMDKKRTQFINDH